jgi:hypothetical protein
MRRTDGISSEMRKTGERQDGGGNQRVAAGFWPDCRIVSCIKVSVLIC